MGGGGKERFCFCILLDRGLPLTFKSKCRLRINCCCFCLRKNTPFIQVDILKKGRCAI